MKLCKLRLMLLRSIERYKANLVAKGYTQLKGIDYLEIFFAFVAKLGLKYVLDIFADVGLSVAKPAASTKEQHLKLIYLNGELLLDPSSCRHFVGRLPYISYIPLLDIVNSAHILSQFMHQHRKPHTDSMLRLLGYLKGTPGQGI
ncbi:Uncharacterized protein TCM_019160 [Theobroma cacao]|uniref:Reverse transcriptase Ty1/copia-type domain-containing protein n=1 Tax=Theobroma cacao TaxID=3641 RepID=A0A061EH07_THECC|nr:Uncharacterized protein TCM_019160 [Theobroma cacao]